MDDVCTLSDTVASIGLVNTRRCSRIVFLVAYYPFSVHKLGVLLDSCWL